MRAKWIRTAAIVASLLLPVAVVGCGGGGGGPTGGSGSCDSTDFAPNYVTSLSDLTHWDGFPVRVFLGPTDSRTRTLTLRGFDQWVTATNGRVSYVLVNDASSADISVAFDINRGQSELGVTTTTFQQRTLIDADIVFYFVPFNSTPDAEIINQAVAAHEFGHALGIGLHSTNPADLMYPETDGSNNTITVRDRNTLLTAYCNTFGQRAATKRRPSPARGPVEKKVISTRLKAAR